MEILLFVSGFAAAFLVLKIFTGKKSVDENEISATNTQDETKYITWTKALNLIQDQILILNKNKIIMFANDAAKDQFGSKIVSTHYASIIRDYSFVEAINSIYESKKNCSVNSEIQFPTYQFFKANIYYIEQNLFDDDFSIMVVLQDLTDLLKLEKLKSDFVANVSHELRTPLQSIKLGIENINGGPAKDDENAKRKFFDIMSKETDRMDQLVTDLLTLSKIEQEEHKRPNDKVNIKLVLENVISILNSLSEKNKVYIKSKVITDDYVLGDNNKLVEIFYNIIENAIKYSEQNKEIIITTERLNDYIVIKVLDHGFGIPETSISRVTERFFRVDPEKSKKTGGTGLGLAIVKHLINQHRGDLVIKSTINKGSEFTIKIPRAN